MKRFLTTLAVLTLCALATPAFAQITKADCEELLDDNIELRIDIAFAKPDDAEDMTEYDRVNWDTLPPRVNALFANGTITEQEKNDLLREIAMSKAVLDDIDAYVAAVTTLRDAGDTAGGPGLTKFNAGNYAGCYTDYSKARGKFKAAYALLTHTDLEMDADQSDQNYTSIEGYLDALEIVCCPPVCCPPE